jgi:hypothetical protein
MQLVPPISRLHMFRVRDPRTGDVHGVAGGSDETIAVHEVTEAARQHPGTLIQVYDAGRWRPWLRSVET